MTAPHIPITGEEPGQKPVTIFGPDFPFAYDDWLTHPDGLGQVPPEMYGTEVAIIGAGMAGMVAAFELMKMGLKPVVYESRRLGGRLAFGALQGRRRCCRRAWRYAFPAFVDGVLPLS